MTRSNMGNFSIWLEAAVGQNRASSAALEVESQPRVADPGPRTG